MRVIIAGNRDFNEKALFNNTITWLLSPDETAQYLEIVSGHCGGADAMGEEFAKHYGLRLKVFPVDCDKHEKLLLSSDEEIQFLVNCQNIAQRKTIVLDSSLNFRPITNATGNLGSSSYRWDNIYSAHAVSVSSDERIKKDLQQIYKAKELIMGIIPYQFKFTYKDADRIHYGFSSQQFKQVLDDVGIGDCGAWTLDVNTQGKQKGHTRETATEDEKIYGLRYEELIAPIVQVLQEFEKRLCNIEEKLNIK